MNRIEEAVICTAHQGVLITNEGDQRSRATMSPVKPAELLLVDDDVAATELLADALEMEGYRVRMASDGQAALARLDEGLPDVVVLDVQMPVLDGPEMALQMVVRDRGKEKIPILLCSGIYDLPRVAAQVGTPYFLAKPYTLEAMLRLLARALTERRTPTPHVSN